MKAAKATASVTWRDGAHITDTPIWCDARRRRDVCFVSSADRVGKTGHGQLIASPLTLALLGASGGGHLAVPLHRRFTLGTVRLELIASGRGPGAAALHVDIAGKTVLYAGAIRTPDAEVRTCDAVVVAAPTIATFPPLAKTIEKTVAWAHEEVAAGKRPVLLVDAPLDGLEVAMALAAENVPIAGSRPIREIAQRAAGLQTAVKTIDLQISTPGKEPRAIVWLARDRTGLSRITYSSIAAVAADDFDEELHFPWTSSASKKELLAWIESTNAREVFVTGACADAIAKVIDARVIGPPHQMQLFEAQP